MSKRSNLHVSNCHSIIIVLPHRKPCDMVPCPLGSEEHKAASRNAPGWSASGIELRKGVTLLVSKIPYVS